jgi:hypothetical protein
MCGLSDDLIYTKTHIGPVGKFIYIYTACLRGQQCTSQSELLLDNSLVTLLRHVGGGVHVGRHGGLMAG